VRSGCGSYGIRAVQLRFRAYEPIPLGWIRQGLNWNWTHVKERRVVSGTHRTLVRWKYISGSGGVSHRTLRVEPWHKSISNFNECIAQRNNALSYTMTVTQSGYSGPENAARPQMDSCSYHGTCTSACRPRSRWSLALRGKCTKVHYFTDLFTHTCMSSSLF
jgi:hypothetical protein